MIRKVLIGSLFTVGVVGSMATSDVAADVSDVSNEIRVSLAPNGEARHDGTVSVVADSPIASGTGQIGLNVTIDGDAFGGIQATIASSTDDATVDIPDVQAQGSARVGIDAFNGCAGATSCDEGLTIDFFRTDGGDGTINLSFSLDALVSTEDGSAGTISFDVR